MIEQENIEIIRTELCHSINLDYYGYSSILVISSYNDFPENTRIEHILISYKNTFIKIYNSKITEIKSDIDKYNKKKINFRIYTHNIIKGKYIISGINNDSDLTVVDGYNTDSSTDAPIHISVYFYKGDEIILTCDYLLGIYQIIIVYPIKNIIDKQEEDVNDILCDNILPEVYEILGISYGKNIKGNKNN